MLLLQTLLSAEDVPPVEWRASTVLAKRVPRLLFGDGRFDPGEVRPPLQTEAVSTFRDDSSASSLLMVEDTRRFCFLSFSSSRADTMTNSGLGDGTLLLLLSADASPKYGQVQGGKGNETEDFFRTGVSWFFVSASSEADWSSLRLDKRQSVLSGSWSSEAESLVLW